MQNRIWEIIAAKVNGEELIPEEQHDFEMWLVSDRKNPRVMQKLEEFYSDYRGKRNVNVDRAYMICVRRLARKQKFRRLKRVSVCVGAASVILLISFATAVFLKKESGRNELPEIVRIEAGEAKAILRLASGQTYALESEKELVLKEGGRVIRNEEKVLIYSSVKDSTMSTDEEVKFDVLEIPRGGEYSLVLEDSTRVWLNSESRLKFPRIFGQEERHVYIEGEAFFDVQKDVSRPFIVSSKGMDIHVLGTTFNVASYKSCREVFTTLVDGAVSIQKGAEAIGTLKPGEQAVFDSLTGGVEVHPVDVALFVSWKDGYYKFERATLEEIMNTLARWYNIDVCYTSEEVREIRFSGKIKRYVEIQEFLDVLESTYDVNFQIDGRTIIVTKK